MARACRSWRAQHPILTPPTKARRGNACAILSHPPSEPVISSFVNAWQASLRVHEQLAENRIRFAQRLHETSEDLLNLAKEVDKSRKQVHRLTTHPCPSC